MRGSAAPLTYLAFHGRPPSLLLRRAAAMFPCTKPAKRLGLISHAGAIYVAIGDTEGAGACDELLRDQPQMLDPASRTRLQAASLLPFKLYNRAMKARVLLVWTDQVGHS